MGTKTQKLSNVVDQIVEWQSVFTGDGSTGLTAVAGRGYFIDTTSGTVTVTLPASPKAGDIVQLKDYARTWGTNAVSIASTTFDGVSNNPSFSTNGQTVTLVYMDGTKGWSLINEDTTTNIGAEFISATGGTVTTSGDYKIHTFTGDGCFVVSCAGNPGGSTSVDYLVVAGGGGGAGNDGGGGGGAGGFREGYNPGSYTASPLATTALSVSTSTYPITVGAGGSGGNNSDSPPVAGSSGSNSVFSTITSTGGGGGANFKADDAGSGGSGGGGTGRQSPTCSPGGNGNTPPVSPPQGNPGGGAVSPDANGLYDSGGGGGGATTAGRNGLYNCSPEGGPGGNGATTSIRGSSTTYAGGGGGGRCNSDSIGLGGPGGGGNGGGSSCAPGVGSRNGSGGTANTGGGGGGGSVGPAPTGLGGAGGKGIVIIRYKFQ